MARPGQTPRSSTHHSRSADGSRFVRKGTAQGAMHQTFSSTEAAAWWLKPFSGYSRIRVCQAPTSTRKVPLP
jgi:hypothetical protein